VAPLGTNSDHEKTDQGLDTLAGLRAEGKIPSNTLCLPVFLLRRERLSVRLLVGYVSAKPRNKAGISKLSGEAMVLGNEAALVSDDLSS